MQAALRSVGLFCGSAVGRDPAHAALAKAFGTEVARAGLRLVYGGGAIGLMGIAARAARTAGAEVVGVIPDFLKQPEIVWDEIEIVTTANLHERVARILELSDAIAVLPGGVGTLEEAAEVLSWARLGLHAKPMAFVAADGFWDPLIAMLDRQIEAGFAPPETRGFVVRASDPGDAVALLGKAACAAPACDFRTV